MFRMSKLELYKKKYNCSDEEINALIQISKVLPDNYNFLDTLDAVNSYIYNFYKSYSVKCELNSYYVNFNDSIIKPAFTLRYNFNFSLFLESEKITKGAYIKYPLQNIKSITLLPTENINNFVPFLNNISKVAVLIENLKQQSFTTPGYNYHFSFWEQGKSNYTYVDQKYVFNTPIQFLNFLLINFYYDFELLYVGTDEIRNGVLYPAFILNMIFECLY